MRSRFQKRFRERIWWELRRFEHDYVFGCVYLTVRRRHSVFGVRSSFSALISSTTLATSLITHQVCVSGVGHSIFFRNGRKDTIPVLAISVFGDLFHVLWLVTRSDYNDVLSYLNVSRNPIKNYFTGKQR